MAREAETIQRLLQKSLYDRYARFGGTIFHLEPNVKDAPGGLRDHHTAQWCTALTKIRETKVVAAAAAILCQIQRCRRQSNS